MSLILSLAYLFFVGSCLGWLLELWFRNIVKHPDKLVNPGFCTGPYLPIYGFGLCVLYLLASLEKFSLISDPLWNKVVLFIAMAIGMTLVEYVAGVFCLKFLKVRLWDYSDLWGNIQGIICPLFTFFWGVLSLGYYFLLYPRLRKLVEWFVAHPLASFMVGVCFGIFLIDLCFSVHLGAVVQKKAAQIDKSVYDAIDVQKLWHKMQSRGGFFRFVSIKPLTERIDAFDEFLHRRPGGANTADKP